jgi:hypothetical protein
VISKANVVSDLSASSEAALGVSRGVEIARPSFADLGGPTIVRRFLGWFWQLTNTQLALVVSATLFALAAWPVALTEVPPLQDLPNHLAAITVIQNPSRYPEFVFNGFFKTNTALFAWLYFVGNAVGTKLASRLFVLLVLAGNALVLPRLVLELTGSRKRMVMASCFAWPFIHNWFVSMGMLDYALGVPLSLFSLLLLRRQQREWSWARAALIAVVAIATWYAHVFTLMVVHLLVGLHVLTGDVRADKGRATLGDRARALRLFVPLLPSTVLVAWSLFMHATETKGAMYGFVNFSSLLPPWEEAYNLWAEWLWGFTKLSISSFVVAVGLAIVAFKNRRERPTFFGPWAFLTMLVMYALLPYIATNWFHVNSRLIAYLWVFALLRVPERLDKRVLALLGVSAVLYSAGMGVDYVRLDRDRAAFTAGMSAVPKDAHLLPLLFNRQLTSENTRSLLHAWGYYVVEKETDAPLLFAHSSSFPVMYRQPPPTRFNHLVLESFAQSMKSPEWICNTMRAGGVVVDCEKVWRDAWADFWSEALPRYDYVLLWEPTPAALALVPPAYKVTFHQDRLTILARDDAPR